MKLRKLEGGGGGKNKKKKMNIKKKPKINSVDNIKGLITTKQSPGQSLCSTPSHPSSERQSSLFIPLFNSTKPNPANLPNILPVREVAEGMRLPVTATPMLEECEPRLLSISNDFESIQMNIYRNEKKINKFVSGRSRPHLHAHKKYWIIV